MNNKQTKKATVDAINVMISHADKEIIPDFGWRITKAAAIQRSFRNLRRA